MNIWQIVDLMNAGVAGQPVEIVEDADLTLGPCGAVAAAYGLSADEFERTTRIYAGFVAIRPATEFDEDKRAVAFYVRRNG